MPYAAVIDFLNSLLEAEMNSIFRFLEEGGPYLAKATPALREPLSKMFHESKQNADELAAAIRSLGAEPSKRQAAPEEQYLTYLSFNFLLPKLIDAKKLMVQRYENGMDAVAQAPPEILKMLKRQVEENQSDADFLGRPQAKK